VPRPRKASRARKRAARKTGSLAARLRAVEDRDEIRELTARYCHAVAAGDAEAIVGLFCEDGVFEMNGRPVVGRAELAKFYGAVAGTPPIPFIQNHVVALNGDTATGRCSVEIRVVQNGEAYTAAGWYDDAYRQEARGWRFAQRKFHVFHWVPLAKGWA
jgi:uncharacterized protein (TIGR02246 family)